MNYALCANERIQILKLFRIITHLYSTPKTNLQTFADIIQTKKGLDISKTQC